MCGWEYFVDQYRGCGCRIPVEYTGAMADCGSPTCGLSSAHMHKGVRNCGCNTASINCPRVRNLYQTVCYNCEARSYDPMVQR